MPLNMPGYIGMGPHSLTFICDGDRLVLQHGSEPVSLEQTVSGSVSMRTTRILRFSSLNSNATQSRGDGAVHGPNMVLVREQPALPASDVPEKWKGYTGH